MGRLGVQKGASQGEPKGSADGEAALPRSPPPPPPRLLRGLEAWAVPTVARQPQEAIWRPVYPSPQLPWQEVTGRAVPRGPQDCEDSQWLGVPGWSVGGRELGGQPGRALPSMWAGVWAEPIVHCVHAPCQPALPPEAPDEAQCGCSPRSLGLQTRTRPPQPEPWGSV